MNAGGFDIVLLGMQFLKAILPFIQILIAILLVAAILIQRRGAGLSEAFGGGSAIYHSKRGLEKTIFTATIIIAILFFFSAALNLFIR